MTDTNTVILFGRVVADAKLSDWNGTKKLDFAIAWNISRKVNNEWVDDVNYTALVLWGKAAESKAAKLVKGKQIIVTGHLKQDRWTDKNGNKNQSLHLICDSIQMPNDGKGGNSAPKFEPINQDNTTAPVSEDIPF